MTKTLTSDLNKYPSYCNSPKRKVWNQPANAGDMGSSPGLGRSPGKEIDNPLKCYCLENPMDRGAWQATAKSQI